MSNYAFLPIVVITLSVYFFSYFLTKTKYLKFPKHRRIWNLGLLLVFLVTGIIGISMSFISSFEIDIEIPFWVKQIHVAFGTVWFIIAFFHFLWHKSYFKKAIKILFSRY